MLIGHRKKPQACQCSYLLRAAAASIFIPGKVDASAETHSKFRESTQLSYPGTTIKPMLTLAKRE